LSAINVFMCIDACSAAEPLFAVHKRRAKMPKVGQIEQPISKDILHVEIESLRKQSEMHRVPVSAALEMLAAW